MKSLFLRLGAVAIGAVLLTSAYYRTSSASVMTEAANRFLASLTPEQRAKATFQFDDAERLNWFFIPIARNGPLPTPSGKRPAERRPQPGGLHEGGHHHEPGRRPAQPGKGLGRAAQPRKILLLHLRHTRRYRNLGLSRRGPPPQPELYRGQRPRGRRP